MSILVVDTSVFLSDPNALSRLEDCDVVIPMTVLLELESKRHHPELGFAARSTLRKLEEYRQQEKSLSEPFKTGESGTLKIDIHELPAEGINIESNDDKILSTAMKISQSGSKVKLLTKDLPLRIRASLFGVEAEEYWVDKFTSEPPGVVTIDVEVDDIDAIYRDDWLDVESSNYPLNTGFILKSPHGSALAILKEDGLRRVTNSSIFDVNGRSAEQRIAIELLMDPEIPIVSLSGRPGSGKSLLALAAGLESTVERKEYKRVIVFRPLYAVGGQDLGFLPGTAEEKMEPWAAAVYDTLGSFCGDNVIDQIRAENLVEVLPLTHIRGRTLEDSYVIIDEAQQLEKMVLLTALTRLGSNSKVVLTYDINQRDNLKVGKYDGVVAVSNLLSGNKLFGHATLSKSERSDVAELVAELIEG